MGMLKITLNGSFGVINFSTSARENGHGHAVAEAINFLAEQVLPNAIAIDHECHEDRIFPDKGFDKSKSKDV